MKRQYGGGFVKRKRGPRYTYAQKGKALTSGSRSYTTRGRYADSGELKFHDLDINDASVAQNGTIIEDSCNTIAQGVTESQRIGRKCTIRAINWRYEFEMIPTGPSSDEVIRLILYLDKQCNGATATITGILESDDFQSFNNLANKSRFTILMDRTVTQNLSGLGGNGTTNIFGSSTIIGSFYKKCNIPIEYDSTTGAITEVRSNNLGVLILGKTGGLTVFGSKMRLRFSDG